MFTPVNENEHMEEEIEGDIVPRWLISDEREEDSGDSLLDEIDDGGTKVQSTTSILVADTCQSM